MADTAVPAAEAPHLGTVSWKRTAAGVCAILLGIVFLVSGGWKLVSPLKTGELLEQAQVPAGLGILGAAALGVLELLAAFLLFVPRLRRWGGLLGSALMIFFIGWIAYYYPVLVGRECSCFPSSSAPSGRDSSSAMRRCCCWALLPSGGRPGCADGRRL